MKATLLKRQSEKNVPLYTVRITLPNGWVEVESEDYQIAVRDVVRSAVHGGDLPKLHWWQFGRKAWSQDCVKEYHRNHA